MANPNINSAANIYCANALVRLDNTSETQVVSNAASSGRVYLIDSIYVANVDGANSCDLTLSIYAAATNTGTATKLTHTIAVPADAALLPILRDAGLCLTESQSIYATASAGGDLHVVCCWKEVS